MLHSLKNIDYVSPRTPVLEQSLVVDAVVFAIKTQSMKDLEEALEKVNAPLDTHLAEYLRVRLIKSDWVSGFDKVVQKCKLETGEGVSSSGMQVKSIVELALEGHAYKLAEHLWISTPKQIQEKCLSGKIELGFALILTKLGEGERIPEEGRGVLITPSVGVLSEGARGAERVVAKEVLHSCVKGRGARENLILWRELCKHDDVLLLKELIADGVVEEQNLSMELPIEYVKRRVMTRGHQDRLSSRLDSLMGSELVQHGVKDTEAVHAFTLPEVMSLYSVPGHKMLTWMTRSEEFRESLMSSKVAQHALVHIICESVWSGDADILLAELKGWGVDMDVMHADGNNNPLHVLALEYIGENDKSKEVFLRIAALHPEWALTKNSDGKTPCDCIETNWRQEVEAWVEALLLSKALSKTKEPESGEVKERDQTLRV